MSQYQAPSSIYIHPEEFVHDSETRLGRANGNTYQRKPGMDNVHDGQIMVRLKKKRFIILDYSYVPNAHDYEIAKAVPHINIPEGAGTAKCSTKDCTRIGVPCLLYDTDPLENMSLYLRGGLCFSCQRNLNEKRRTQRKRKPEELVDQVHASGDMSRAPSGGHESQNGSRFKFNDQIIELNPDAIVINGPVDGTRTRGPNYGCPEIGSDLLRIVNELSQETLALLQHSSGAAGLAQPLAPPTAMSVDAHYQRAFSSVSKATFLLAQWKASFDENVVANAAHVTTAAADSRILDEAVASQHMHAQGGYLAHDQPLVASMPMQPIMPMHPPMQNNGSHQDQVEI